MATQFEFNSYLVTTKVMTKIEALFYCHLVDHWNTAKYWAEKDNCYHLNNNGWFLCTRNHLKNSLDWSYATQNKLLKSLKNKKFIQVKMMGLPAQRYVNVSMGIRNLHKLMIATNDKVGKS